MAKVDATSGEATRLLLIVKLSRRQQAIKSEFEISADLDFIYQPPCNFAANRVEETLVSCVGLR